MNKKNYQLVFSLVLPLLAGVVGSIFTTPKISTWYQGLVKPSFNPPNYLFGPVWTVLFIMMGLALFIVWQKGISVKKVQVGIFLFCGQLVLNIFWSIIFFGLERPWFAFMEIIVLWLAIAATARQFFQINRTAGYLFLPYLLWVSFAAVLNFYIWRLN